MKWSPLLEAVEGMSHELGAEIDRLERVRLGGNLSVTDEIHLLCGATSACYLLEALAKQLIALETAQERKPTNGN